MVAVVVVGVVRDAAWVLVAAAAVGADTVEAVVWMETRKALV